MNANESTYLDVCLDLDPKLLQVLNNGAVDGTAQIGMLISYGTGPVPDLIVHVLLRGVEHTPHCAG